MWCPKCNGEYPGGETVCPRCGVPLTELLVSVVPPAASGPQMEFLMFFADREELELALDELEEAGIPWECRNQSGSGYRRLTRGAGGTELYVDARYTHRAMRLLRRYDRDLQQPFDDDELETAIADYVADYGDEAEPEEPDQPVSPEGYRMVFVFLAVFGALALLAVLAAVLG